MVASAEGGNAFGQKILSYGLPGVWAGGIGFLDTFDESRSVNWLYGRKGNRIKVCEKIVVRLDNL